MRKLTALIALLILALGLSGPAAFGSEKEKPQKVDYRFTPPAPRDQSQADVAAKSEGCYSCHTRTDLPS
ncbi:MAG: hypothetical protein RLZZ58_1011, partial [Pseudomonadota bacterium]